jgi:hypothetical protein
MGNSYSPEYEGSSEQSPNIGVALSPIEFSTPLAPTWAGGEGRVDLLSHPAISASLPLSDILIEASRLDWSSSRPAVPPS